jgi:hypothetical protein
MRLIETTANPSQAGATNRYFFADGGDHKDGVEAPARDRWDKRQILDQKGIDLHDD